MGTLPCAHVEDFADDRAVGHIHLIVRKQREVKVGPRPKTTLHIPNTAIPLLAVRLATYNAPGVTTTAVTDARLGANVEGLLAISLNKEPHG
jgi:hypothetical protein